MNKAKFWRLIEEAKSESHGDLDEQVDVLRHKLEKLAAEEILRFQNILDEQMAAANRWDLWGAAYIINGGCSDDGFTYFRGWLIAQGQRIFEAALHDPESLAEVAEAEGECEAILSVPAEAYESKVGSEMPEREARATEPAGDEWTEEELPELYPRLWEAFGEGEEEEA